MDKFCKFCGIEHAAVEYPKHCKTCNQITYVNPTPVAVIGVKVRSPNGRIGILIGERGIQPQKGMMALISGFVDPGDLTIEHGAVRELFEETGIVVPVEDVEMVSSYNTGKNMLVFCRAKTVLEYEDVMAQFKPNYECPRIDIAWESRDLAFESHTKMLGVFNPPTKAAKPTGHSAFGRVKWYDSTKGLGFIIPEAGGGDIFLFSKNIPDELLCVTEGQRVSFEIGRMDTGHVEALGVQNAPA